MESSKIPLDPSHNKTVVNESTFRLSDPSLCEPESWNNRASWQHCGLLQASSANGDWRILLCCSSPPQQGASEERFVASYPDLTTVSLPCFYKPRQERTNKLSIASLPSMRSTMQTSKLGPSLWNRCILAPQESHITCQLYYVLIFTLSVIYASWAIRTFVSCVVCSSSTICSFLGFIPFSTRAHLFLAVVCEYS